MFEEIFENLLLTEETQTQIKEAFASAVEAHKAELELEYKEKEATLQEEASMKVQDLVAESISTELDALAEELEHARTLEVQYAEKLELFKEAFSAAKEDEVRVLVAETVQEELDELKEDIEQGKKFAFGKQLFEAFADAYAANFGNTDVDVVEQLKEAKAELEAYKRAELIDELLEGIGGKERAVFTTLLENSETDKLKERFESIKPIVLRESENSDKTVVQESTAPVIEEQAVEQQDAVLVTEGQVDDSLNKAFARALKIANR